MASDNILQSIRIEHHFDVPVERLFRAWCDPGELAAWAWGSLGDGTSADVDFRIGGSFRVATRRPDGDTWSFTGSYTDIQPDRRISHTLAWQAPMGYDAADEHVEVDFRSDGAAGSVIEFVHSGVPDSLSADGHSRGWANVLETLDEYLKKA
jgi:uncharacterized protein YndB with AHSA1/START domain